MAGARSLLVALASLLVLGLVAVFGLVALGDHPGELWADVALPAAVLGGCLGLLCLALLGCSALRVRRRHRRPLARYQLVLSQADEATFEEVAACCEQLVQTLRASLTERFVKGQPWLALESWFVPAARDGETGSAVLMLLCEPRTRDAALAALRRAYPDLGVRSDEAGGRPLEFVEPSFRPGHVLRVRKARSWALPIGSAANLHQSDGRSAMGGIIRQQQQAARLSCVRWCLLPAADQLDSTSAERLERFVRGERSNAAVAGDVQQALRSAGGAMCFLELQASVERGELHGRRGRTRAESLSELQNACRQLLSPALSQRGANHLTERLMVVRQRLYRRRFARGEPPLLPDPSGATLVSPRELAALLELPSLGSEHALPLQRNTVPQLPTPIAASRARLVTLPFPAGGGEGEAAAAGEPADADAEVVDAEVVWEEEVAS